MGGRATRLAPSSKEQAGNNFESWTHTLALGQPLPTLPLWLADDFAVPLELEASYEETCPDLPPGVSGRARL